jgi:cytochrome P450
MRRARRKDIRGPAALHGILVRMSAIAPGPRGRFFVGSLPEMRADPAAFLKCSQAAYGDVVRFSFGGKVAHLVSSPSGIRHVLQSNARNYTKQTRGIRMLKAILGEGLLTSDGEFWLRQRRIAQPAFHRERLHAFADLIDRHAEDLCMRWRAAAARGEPVNAHREMMALTLTIVGEALFGADVAAAAPKVAHALDELLTVQDARFTRAIPLPPWLPVAENRRFDRAKAALDDVCVGMIRARRASSTEGRGDLLSMLMEARDPETGEGMSDAQLRDEVVTTFVAGHETTANALTYALQLLGSHPCELGKLQRAVDERFPSEISCREAFRFGPVERAVNESLRLYPPGWLFARAPIDDDVVDGFAIPKGSFVFVSAWVVHRKPSLWTDPDAFAPDRFEGPGPDRFAFFPYSGGPRQCIGAPFADMEMHAILARLARAFSWRAVNPMPRIDPKVTLRPKGDILLEVTPRTRAPAA